MDWRHAGGASGPANASSPRAAAALFLTIVFTATCGAAADEPSAETVPPDHAQQMARSLELFKSGVRQTLTTHCVQCHGGDETHGEFDLTTRAGLIKGGASGPVVTIGKPEQSRLLELVRHEDEPHMPAEAPRLHDDAVEQLATWITSGAAYDAPLTDATEALVTKTVSDEDRQFWSFRPLQSADVPPCGDPSWCRNPIDHFVLARLESAGRRPSASADRRRLIRRAYFDLIGLPPTPEEIDAFLADESSDPFASLVDRLLDSQHYGERWARHWLDVARFAESHGYEQDDDRPTAYHYRDFVIQALNQDMPYDQFVRWQLAGDEYEPDNHLALMATGFLAAGTHATQITANQVEKERYDELDDMAATTGTAMLGLTIGCARCHDHKFDPIPQGDYYRLLSTFTTTVRSEVDLDFDPAKTKRRREQFEQAHAPLVEARTHFEADELPARFDKWLASNPQPVAPPWLILEAESATSEGGATLTLQDDGSYLASETNAKHDTYTFTVVTGSQPVTALRIDALPDPSLPKQGPGRADNGNFALSDFQLWAAPAGTEGTGAPVKLVSPEATFSQEGLPVASAIDDRKKSAWAVEPEIGKAHSAAFQIETPIALKQGAKLTIILRFENNAGHNLGRLRLSLSLAAKPVALAGEQVALKEVLAVNEALAAAADERTDQQRDLLFEWYRRHDPDWQQLDAAVQAHTAEAPQPELTKVLIASEGLPPLRLRTQGADFFEETFYLKRGDLQQKLGPAEPGFLQVLTTVPGETARWHLDPPEGWHTSYRRRALAEWITDTDGGAGHLLARVIVNRLWQHHFGRGLVATPSDFGHSGEAPTHPELLDYLAQRLIDEGWRLKPLHRLMMTSSVYRQEVAADPRRAEIDPDNRLLWRRNRTRLEAEAIRDAMLAVSGQLDTTMFGPGTLDPEQPRRSIYFTVKRSKLIPDMMLFDAPDALQGLAQRATTVVAPQALAMLNSPNAIRAARAMAKRLLLPEGSTPRDRVREGFVLALGRPPDETELSASLAFVERATEKYADDETADATELAMADFCQVLFSMNEFIYIE